MHAHMGNTSLAWVGRKKNSVVQPNIAAGPTSQSAGTLKGRNLLFSVTLKIMTLNATRVNANRVPELEISASLPTGKKLADKVTRQPVKSVMI